MSVCTFVNRKHTVSVCFSRGDLGVGDAGDMGPWLANMILKIVPLCFLSALQDMPRFILRVVVPLECDAVRTLGNQAEFGRVV